MAPSLLLNSVVSPLQPPISLAADWLTSRPIAHRGLHDGQGIPENSLLACSAAIARHYPIELDIQLLADGNLAVFHDETLERLTGLPGTIHGQDTDRLPKLRLLGTDQRIPTLQEVLALVGGRVPLLLEIKNTSYAGALERTLWHQLSTYSGDYAVQSFNPYSLGWFKIHAPQVRRGQLASDFAGIHRLPWHNKLLLQHLLMNWMSQPHFIAYKVQCLPHWVTHLTRRLGLPLLAWVVQTEAERCWSRRWADNMIFEGFCP